MRVSERKAAWHHTAQPFAHLVREREDWAGLGLTVGVEVRVG